MRALLRRFPTIAAALVALWVATPAWAGTGFTFRVPEGWTDLSSSAPAKNFEGVPKQVLAEARSGKYVAYAMDFAHADDGFAENFNAIVAPGSEPITTELLDAAASGMSASIGKSGGSAEVRERGLVKVSGVDAGRLVADIQVGAIHTRAMIYILPGKDEVAYLTYSATPETFDQYRPIFEAAAAATGGVVAPHGFWDRVLGSGMRGALIGAGAGIVAGIVAMALRKNKKNKAAG